MPEQPIGIQESHCSRLCVTDFLISIIAPRPSTTPKKAQPPNALPAGQPLLRPPGEMSYVAVAPTPKVRSKESSYQLLTFQQLLKPVQSTTTGATPVYTLPAAALANAEEQEKKVCLIIVDSCSDPCITFGITTKPIQISKLLDDNANLINVIRENLMNGKMSDNVEPMNRFHKNIYTVLSW